MKFIDLFAGIGGFRSGLEKAGHQCIGYIEWDKFARQSYEAIYDTDGEFTAHDIQEVKGEQLPNAELWTFGSPCTNISIAGNRIGIRGDASRMFFEVIRLLKERIKYQKTLPTYLIMENVKNLLSSNEGRDFAEVVYQMDSIGYDAEWCVFDSAEVVPQHRERIYIVGHLRDQRTRGVFPIQRQGSDSSQSNGIRVVGNLSPTLNTMQGGNRQPQIIVRPCLTPERMKKRQNGRRFKENGEPAFTVTVTDRNGVMLKNGDVVAIRKLTPRECWRLQGFSDEQFDEAKRAGVSNSQLYKQAGNAVTVPVVKAIGQKLKENEVYND